MADDDDKLSLSSGYTSPPADDSSKDEETDQSAKDDKEDKDDQADQDHKEDKEPEKPDQKPDDVKTELAAVNQHLNALQDRDTKRASENDSMREELAKLKSLVDQPPPDPPTPASLPPPPTEKHKGDASEFAVNMLKFGALLAIAYGTTRRGNGSSATMKLAIGSALEGYFKGQKDVRDSSMQVWEKNNEVMRENNKQQLAEYHNTLNDRRLGLSSQMDILRAQAEANRDYKMESDAERKDLVEVQKNLVHKQKLQQDYDKYVLQHRDKIYSAIGRSNQSAKYLAWLREKSGGKYNFTLNTDVDSFNQMEKDNPNLSFSSFLKEQEQQEKQEKLEKEKRDEAARIREKQAPTYKEQQEQEAEKKAAEDKQKGIDESNKILKDIFGK